MMNSIFVYFVIVLSVIFAILTQREKVLLPCATLENQCYQYMRFNKKYFIASYLLIIAVVALCASSHDYLTYVQFYETWTFSDVLSTKFEPGYVLLNVILHCIIKSGVIGTAIIKIVSLTLVYCALYKLKDKINVGFSILAYDTLLLIYNFQLLRMMLAVSICFLAIAYELTGMRHRSVFFLVIAIFFHYSSVFLILTYLLYVFIGRRIDSLKTMFVFGVFICLLFSFNRILTYAIANYGIFAKYRTSTAGFATISTDIGLLQFVLFVPVLIVLFSYYRKENKTNFYTFGFLTGVMTFVMGFLSYFYSTLERGTYYFYCFFVFYCASIPLKAKSRIQIKIQELNINFPLVCAMAYLCLYLYLLLPGKIENAGLQKYVFVWEYM